MHPFMAICLGSSLRQRPMFRKTYPPTIANKISFRLWVFFLASLTSLYAAPQTALVWDSTQGNPVYDNDEPFTVGFRFRPNSDIAISSLGVFDFQGDAFSTPVGITYLGTAATFDRSPGLVFPELGVGWSGQHLSANFQFEVVPEPSGALLLLTGLALTLGPRFLRAQSLWLEERSHSCEVCLAETHSFLQLEISLDPIPNSSTSPEVAEGDEPPDPGPHPLDRYWDIATVDESLLNPRLETSLHVTSSCREVEGTCVSIELGITPQHLYEMWEVVRVTPSAPSRAMRGDHCDSTF